MTAAAWNRAPNRARDAARGGAVAARPARPETQPTTCVYLRPLGLIIGRSARAAVAGGWAHPLHGDGCAFTGCELLQRGAASEFLSMAQLEFWRGGQPEHVQTRVGQLLDRLGKPPPGLPVRRPAIMGVLNVTPDSFSDGGCFLEPGRAIAHGRRLHAEGADVIDVGGESTRPGAEPVLADEEIRRVVPVVEALAGAGLLVSIDTRKAVVMQAALAAGARMINDVTALRHDPDSLAVAGASGVPVVLMHSLGEPATMQTAPRYDAAPRDVFDQLERRIDAWSAAGFDRSRLLVDPGIGFGKTIEHNLEILANLGLYLGLGVPVLLGASRKSFIGRITGGAPTTERLPGSLAAALWAGWLGVAMVRVHDVAATRQALAVWQAMEHG